jgi:hypothetical protein
METSPLPMKGCKIEVHAWAYDREGSLSYLLLGTLGIICSLISLVLLQEEVLKTFFGPDVTGKGWGINENYMKYN